MLRRSSVPEKFLYGRGVLPWFVHPQCAYVELFDDGAQTRGVVLVRVRVYDMVNPVCLVVLANQSYQPFAGFDRAAVYDHGFGGAIIPKDAARNRISAPGAVDTNSNEV